jgi:hypothetical protein
MENLFIPTVARQPRDLQIVQEFRAQLRVAEDLVAKLAFNLREISGSSRPFTHGTTGNQGFSATLTEFPSASLAADKPR